MLQAGCESEPPQLDMPVLVTADLLTSVVLGEGSARPKLREMLGGLLAPALLDDDDNDNDDDNDDEEELPR
eukprot:COSAG01_NODE_52072_length_349_cov_1.036000_1_plen_70_part_01